MTSVLQSKWYTLAEQPLTFVREQALAACLGHEVSAEQMVTLRDAPRFAPRMQQRLLEHFQLRDLTGLPVPDDADLQVLLLDEAQLARLPRLCGAVWHAATLSREIRGEVVNQYRQELGADTLRLALDLRQLAGAADLLRTPAALIEAIDRDGAACMGAWLAAQSESLRRWLRLRLDPSIPQHQADPRQALVVRSVAAALAQQGAQETTDKGSADHD